MATDKTNILIRYSIIIGCVVIVSIAIVVRASRTIFVEGKHWQEKADSLRIEDIIIQPNRGNILAQDGRLMASSIPQYYLYIDFQADGLNADTLKKYIIPLSQALSNKFKDRSASDYKAHLMKGLRLRSRQYPIINRKVSFTDMKEVKTYPFLKLSSNKCGFYTKKMVQRKKPFATLASRTIGDIYGEFEKGGKNGLELEYDSLLRGIPGTSTKQKVRGRWLNVVNIEPVDGMDIKTTIDIEIQDITENALTEKLKEIDAESGTAVVMDVKTGEVKAITNIARISPGEYAETKNHAVADEIEPGSTFKVASMIIALEEGIVQPDDTVDAGDGLFIYAGARMTDHNRNKGGYHRISAAQTIWYSSNIGVAKIILKGFEKRPQDYVDRLYKMKLNEPMNLEIPGAGRPKIKHPIKDKNLWSRTSLPWMSFGYETQIPPIYTLAFYNAIANNGKMIKPIFVKEICHNGAVLEKKETETINSSICSDKTLDIIRQMLVDVVEKGTGSAVKSDYIKIAGKTGTAQISQGKAGYKAAGVRHQVSFCGYFPADDPQYSCIVVIRNPRIGYPSGGTMSGGVFKNIAEQVYARSLVLPLSDQITDSIHSLHPQTKGGDYKSLVNVLRKLDIPLDNQSGESPWVKSTTDHETITLKDLKIIDNRVPQVIGLGARDAVFIMENAGLHVNLTGKGRVVQQSLPPGSRLTKGQTVLLTLR